MIINAIFFVLVLVLVLVVVRVREPTQQSSGLVDVDVGGMFDYERLDVHQCALRYVALAFEIIKELPRGHSTVADQMRWATISIPLHIAELQEGPPIARGSAMECGAIIDIIRLLGLAPDKTERARELLIRIVSMLSKMTR